MPGIGFDRVDFAYRGAEEPSLNDLSFRLRSPTTFVLGENGSGKTTTFKVLMGGPKPSRGTVLTDGLQKRGIGYCPQEFRLPGHVAAKEYLEYVAWLRGIQSRDVVRTVERSLGAVGVDPGDPTKLASLSGGFKRRIGLAAALLGSPQLVLLDEPTSGLDPASRVMIRETIARFAERTTLMISTHLVEDIPPFGPETDLLVLVGGSCAYFGKAAELDRQGPSVAGASSREAALIRLMNGGHNEVG